MYVQGNCKNGYADGIAVVNSTTFKRADVSGCSEGYDLVMSQYDILYAISEVGATKCPIGYHPTANGCVAYTQSDCPDGYLATLPVAAFARYNANGECDTDYVEYGDTVLCAEYVGANTADLCTPLCDYGYDHTRADTCARPCNHLNYLVTSNGTSFPLYLDKTTDRAMGVGMSDNGVCFVNLLTGKATGTINILDENGTVYHAVR